MKFAGVLFAASVALAASESIVVTTVTTNTHKSGRFDKTAAASTTSATGSEASTHTKGRFNKTKASSVSTSSGTHVSGRFDKTKAGTSTVYVTTYGKDVNGANAYAAGFGSVLVAGLALLL